MSLDLYSTTSDLELGLKILNKKKKSHIFDLISFTMRGFILV